MIDLWHLLWDERGPRVSRRYLRVLEDRVLASGSLEACLAAARLFGEGEPARIYP
jgi:hypothetical protein